MKTYPIEILTPDELALLLKAFPNTTAGRRDRMLVWLMYGTGIRCAEVLDISKTNVDFSRNAITIVRGKGGRRRVVGVVREVMEALRAWMPDIRPDEKIFQTACGRPLITSHVRRAIRRAGRKAGIVKRVHPHQCRHTFAANAMTRGVDLRLIQRQLGHANIATTDTYVAHLGDPEVLTAMSQLSYS